MNNKQLKIPSLLKNPANGGIPAIENIKQLNDKPRHKFWVAKKLQLIRNLGKLFYFNTTKITLNNASDIIKYIII